MVGSHLQFATLVTPLRVVLHAPWIRINCRHDLPMDLMASKPKSRASRSEFISLTRKQWIP